MVQLQLRFAALSTERKCNVMYYYMAELIHGRKEHSEWLPERSEFYCKDY